MPIAQRSNAIRWKLNLRQRPNCRAIAVGAGRTLDPDWMKGKPGGWENELLVAYLRPTWGVAAYSVPLVDGAFLWGGKVHHCPT